MNTTYRKKPLWNQKVNVRLMDLLKLIFLIVLVQIVISCDECDVIWWRTVSLKGLLSGWHPAGAEWGRDPSRHGGRHLHRLLHGSAVRWREEQQSHEGPGSWVGHGVLPLYWQLSLNCLHLFFTCKYRLFYFLFVNSFLSQDMNSFFKKILDLTYPVTSMFSGASFNSSINVVFKGKQIEVRLEIFLIESSQKRKTKEKRESKAVRQKELLDLTKFKRKSVLFKSFNSKVWPASNLSAVLCVFIKVYFVSHYAASLTFRWHCLKKTYLFSGIWFWTPL